MGTTIQEVGAGSGYFGGVQLAQAQVVVPRRTEPEACDRVDFTPDLRGIVSAQGCSNALALQQPGGERPAAMYGRELAMLDRLIARAQGGDEAAHRAIVATFERYVPGGEPSDARGANRFRDYRGRLETYISESMWRGNHRYADGQNSELAYNAAVARVLARREPNPAVLGTENTLAWLANAPPSILQSFGTNPELVPWLAALQTSPHGDVPRVRAAWDNLQSRVASSRTFRSTYTSVLEAMPQAQRAAFSAGVIDHLERSVRAASLPSARQFSGDEVRAYEADLRGRIAFVRANP